MKWRIKPYNIIDSEENYLFLCGEKAFAIFSESLHLSLLFYFCHRFSRQICIYTIIKVIVLHCEL